jgi:hypothetical protein
MSRSEEMGSPRRKPDNTWWISIAGLIVLLVFTHGADILLSFLRRRNASTFALGKAVLGSQALIALLLAILVLLLAWFVLIRAVRNVWVASLYLLIGLLIVSYPSLWFAGFLYNWLPFGVRGFLADFLLTSTLTYYAGGFVVVIGFLSLIRPRGEKNDPR